MNTWEILDMTFSGVRGYGDHNRIDFKNIPRKQVIGINTVFVRGYANLMDMILFCMSLAYVDNRMYNVIYGGKTTCRCSITLQKENRLFRIKRTVFMKRIPEDRNSKIITVTAFYEMIQTSNGTELIILNGIDEATTRKNIQSIFGLFGSITDREIWSYKYYGASRDQVLARAQFGAWGQARSTENYAVANYAINKVFVKQCPNLSSLLNDTYATLQVEKQWEIKRERIASIQNDVQSQLGILARQLNFPVPYLEITGNQRKHLEPGRNPYDTYINIKFAENNDDVKETLENSICANFMIYVALVVGISEGMDRPRPNFFVIHTDTIWSWLTDLQIETILNYLFSHVDYVFFEYDGAVKTANDHQISDWVDVEIPIMFNQQTKLKSINYP